MEPTSPDAPGEPDTSIYKDKVDSKQAKHNSSNNLKKSIDAAKGKKCFWHPYRDAYAVCSFCNRAFCFEDLTKLNDSYYCLEDIDSVSSTYDKKLRNLSHVTATISGLLLIVAFIAFFYFYYYQTVYILKLFYATGLSFKGYATYGYIITLIESALAVIGFFSAFYIFVQSNRGFYVGMIASVGNILLLSYQLVSTPALHFGLIDALFFIALISLVYSRMTAGITGRIKSERSTAETNEINWPNAGKF